MHCWPGPCSNVQYCQTYSLKQEMPPKKRISVPEEEVKATRVKNKHKENARVWKNWLFTPGHMGRMKQSMLRVYEGRSSVTSSSFPAIQYWHAGTNWIKIKTTKGKGETTLFISFHIWQCGGNPWRSGAAWDSLDTELQSVPTDWVKVV